MTIGEKLIKARLDLNLSQIELAAKAGISERSVYNYEQTGSAPRTAILHRLADALNVTVAYLVDENETDKNKNIDNEQFLASAKTTYGSKGAREAKEVIEKASALFAGGDLDEEAKEIFMQSLQEVYLESKAEARVKFTPKRRKKRKP